MNNPRRGEIWLVDLDPTRGSEMKKTRLVLVISSDAMGVLPVKLGVPITEWQPGFANHVWHVRLEPDQRNGVTKTSALDIAGARAGSRAIRQTEGCCPAEILMEVTAALAAIIEYESE